ncbi:MAG: phospholipase A [Burkholderiales bacterium]
MSNSYSRHFWLVPSCVALVLTFPLAFASEPSGLARCRSISDDAQRLDCYDRLSESEHKPAAAAPAAEPQAVRAVEDPSRKPTERDSRWSIAEGGVHRLVPHKSNYVILRQSSRPNNQPFSASNEFLGSANTAAPIHLDHNEMKFQLSLKAPIVQSVPLLGGNLWFAYTQQSNWQVWNAGISRPFRETDYEPEILLNYQLDRKLTDRWTIRHLTWALNHQSNGRGEPLSRSWNRIYAQLELDRGKDLQVLLRPWWRIPESRSNDDNPDIQHYLGYGDLVVNYKAADWNASLLLRNNLERSHNRGAAQLDVAFPCAYLGDFVLKLQLFSGYGESLIDYNHRQTTIGVGLEATGWMDHRFSRAPGGCAR